VQLKGDEPHIRYNLAYAYFFTGANQEAIDEFAKGERLSSYHDCKRMSMTGMAYQRLEQYKEAAEWFGAGL